MRPGISGRTCSFSSLTQLMNVALRISVDLEAAARVGRKRVAWAPSQVMTAVGLPTVPPSLRRISISIDIHSVLHRVTGGYSQQYPQGQRPSASPST
jgi:hypothetical protein